MKQAFSHYTWEASAYNLLICDIQVYTLSDRSLLTRPQSLVWSLGPSQSDTPIINIQDHVTCYTRMSAYVQTPTHTCMFL